MIIDEQQEANFGATGGLVDLAYTAWGSTRNDRIRSMQWIEWYRISTRAVFSRNGHICQGVYAVMHTSTSLSSPIDPRSIIRRAWVTAGAKRSWKFTAPISFFARHKSRIVRACSMLSPMGF